MGRLYFLALTFTLVLTACGVSQQQQDLNPERRNPAAFKEFTEQTVVWEACDPNAIGPDTQQLIEPIKDRLECATIKAPLDWYNPKLDKIDLAILRVKASDAQARKGAIFINPGGPGKDGLLFGLLFGNYAATAQAPLPAAAELQQISAQYDIVGFSPRGVGSSTQLTCEIITVPPTNFYTDRSQENVQALLTMGRLSAEACQKNPLTKYINTDQTARDMNLMRILLGDSKLNYLGYSYGTWLGAWYAKLFPAETGNFVLDSNIDFSARSLNEAFNSQAEAFQNGLEKIAIPYLVRNSVVFELGNSNEAVYAIYDTLPIEIKAVVTGQIIDALYDASGVSEIGVLLVASKGLNTVFQATSAPLDDPENFLKQVETYDYAPKYKDLDDAARAQALALAQGVLGELEIKGKPFPLDQDATFTTILCNDGQSITSAAYWAFLGDRDNELNPLLGGVVTGTPCASWKNPSARVPFSPIWTPVLMVQSEFDPATNTSGARRALYSTPNAEMVFINDEKDHSVFPHSECVDKAVVKHLLDGTMPGQKVANCAANPLPGETQVYPADGLVPFSVGEGMTDFVVEDETTLADRMHEIVQENAVKTWGNY